VAVMCAASMPFANICLMHFYILDFQISLHFYERCFPDNFSLLLFSFSWFFKTKFCFCRKWLVFGVFCV